MNTGRAAHDNRPAAGGWRDVAIVMAVALAVRLAYFFLNSHRNPAFDYLIMDSMHIDRWARSIAAGDAGPAVYFRGPLYPYLLALIYKFTGGSISAAVMCNHVMGTVTCGVMVLLARQYFGRAVALTAGLVAALYWPFIYFEGELLVEPLFVLLVVLSLWRLARALAAPGVVRLLAAGVSLGMAALARPTLLIFVAVLPLVFRFVTGATAWPAALRRSGVVIAAAIVVLIPATLHNYRGAHRLVPVAWSGGLNFYIGNNPQADGRSAYLPDAHSAWMGGEEEALAIAGEQAGRTLTPAQASSFYFHRGLDYLAAQPVDALKLFGSKFYMFWEGPERSNEKYIYFFWKHYGLGKVPMPGFWLVAPLAVLGLVWSWARRRDLLPLYAFLLAYMVGVIAFFVVSRLRLPVVPVMILFAAAAAVELSRRIRAHAWRRVIAGAAVFLAAFLFSNVGYPHFARQRPTHDIISHYTLAAAWLDHDRKDDALLELARARLAYERAPSGQYAGLAQDVYFKLGSMLFERGRCKEAADALGQIQPSNPRAHDARLMFAECREKERRFDEARRAYELILKSDPDDSHALQGLVRCLEGMGKYDEASRVRARLPQR